MNKLSLAQLHAGLSDSDTCEILGRSLRTLQHWRQHGAPAWALRVLAIYAGDLTPLGWDGWILRRDRLYAPDLKYGWERGHLYSEWWNRQRLAFLDRQIREMKTLSISDQKEQLGAPALNEAVLTN